MLIISECLPLPLDSLPEFWHHTLQRHSYFCFSEPFLWNAVHQQQKGALIDLGTENTGIITLAQQMFSLAGNCCHCFYVINAITHVILVGMQTYWLHSGFS